MTFVSAFVIDAWSTWLTFGYLFQVWQKHHWPYEVYAVFLGVFHLSSFLASSFLWRLPRLPDVDRRKWQVFGTALMCLGSILAAWWEHPAGWVFYLMWAGLCRPETASTLSLFAQMDVRSNVFREMVKWREMAATLGVFTATFSLAIMFEYGKDALAVFSLCQTACCIYHICSVLLLKPPMVVTEQAARWPHVSTLGVTERSYTAYDNLVDWNMWWAFCVSACNYAFMTYLVTYLLSMPEESLAPVPFVVLGISMLSWAGALAGVHETSLKDTMPMSLLVAAMVVLTMAVVAANNLLTWFVFNGPSYFISIMHALAILAFSAIHSSPLLFLFDTVHEGKSSHLVYVDRFLGMVYLGRLVGISISWFQFVWLDASPYLACLIAVLFFYSRLLQANREFQATKYSATFSSSENQEESLESKK